MRKLFPETENWVLTTLFTGEANIVNRDLIQNLINGSLGELLQLKLNLEGYNVEEYTILLNKCLSEFMEEQSVRDYYDDVFNFRDKLAYISLNPQNDFDLAGVLLVLKYLNDNLDMAACSNPNELVSDLLCQLRSDVLYVLQSDEDDYEYLESTLNFNHLAFSFDMVCDEKFMKMFVKTLDSDSSLIAQVFRGKYSYFLSSSCFREFYFTNIIHQLYTQEDWELAILKNQLLSCYGNDITALKSLLRSNGNTLKLLSDEQRSDVELVRIAIASRPIAIQYVNLESASRELIELLLSNGVFENLPDAVRNNINDVRIAIVKDPTSIKYAGEQVKNDFETMLFCVNYQASLYEYASEELKANREFNLRFLSVNQNACSVLFHYHPDIFNDREFCVAALNKNPLSLMLMPDTIKSDKDLVSKAILENYRLIQYASVEIRSDLRFMLSYLHLGPVLMYKYAGENLQNNADFALAAMSLNPLIIKLLPTHLQNQEEIFAKLTECEITKMMLDEYLDRNDEGPNMDYDIEFENNLPF